MSRILEFAKQFSARRRVERFARFEDLASGLGTPLKIIDIGGEASFWEAGGWAGRDDVEITVVNLPFEDREHDNIRPVMGDATDLSEFADNSFDIAFSNSVIEHLYTRQNQEAMAREAQRVGRAYWVQSPNFWFPVEPHFLFVGWQWLPESVRVAILMRKKCGWYRKEPDRAKALDAVKEIRLLTRRDLRTMFPDGRVEAERFFGIAKSWIAIGGM